MFHASNDYIGNVMWLLGPGGIHIYRPDGKEEKVFINGTAICHEEPAYHGSGYYRPCRYYDVLSDGKKYVWASLARGVPKINLFDINTGAIVGAFDTCMSPTSLEYHPLREEVWVRCSDYNENSTHPSNLDVFSASSPSGDIQTDILMGERALKEGLSSQGSTVIHNTLGDVGYLTDNELPYLFKMDLSTKSIIDKFELTPTANGLDLTAYSPVNRHIFVKSEVCCTCGFEGSDLGASCGRSNGTMINPKTGKFAGQTGIQGVCGSSCEGKANIDTIGIYEFDTETETVVGTHLMKEGIGGEPYPSPDGKYIVLLARNGGKTIRIIETGENGKPSQTFVDLELGFSREGYETKSVSKDFAFVTRNDKTLAVFPSGTENKVAIVDMTSKPIKTSFITFNEQKFKYGAPHGMYRRIEWAIGTDYVWVTDSSYDEAYVIDVVKNEVVKTLTDVDVSQMLSVQNYDYSRQFEMQKKMILDLQKQPDPVIKETTALEVAAIVLGALAIVVGIANYMKMMYMRQEFLKNTSPKETLGFIEAQKNTDEESSSNMVPSVN